MIFPHEFQKINAHFTTFQWKNLRFKILNFLFIFNNIINANNYNFTKTFDNFSSPKNFKATSKYIRKS